MYVNSQFSNCLIADRVTAWLISGARKQPRLAVPSCHGSMVESAKQLKPNAA